MARHPVQQAVARLVVPNIILVLIISLNNNQYVQSSIIDSTIEKFHELKDNIINSLKNFYKSFRRVMKSKLIIKPPDEDLKLKWSTIHDNFKEFMPIGSSGHWASLEWKLRRHTVRTEDGYILTLHHMPFNNDKSKLLANRTVLLHHGLLGSSADWALLGPKRALPYLLSVAGYDVWLTNARGNCYSRDHISKTPNSRDFWDFSWQEMGEYDLPAVIEYIRKEKKSEEAINYIGHSMGATAVLVLLSMKPEFNKYLRAVVLLAPLARMTRLSGPMVRLAPAVTGVPHERIMDYLGGGEFMPSKRIPSILVNQYCSGRGLMCMNALLFLTGGLLQDVSVDPNFLNRLLVYVPAGGSTKTVLHYAQLINNKKFHRFNEKTKEFPIKNITAPVIIFSSNDDWISNVLDNQLLYFSIVNPVAHIIIEDQNVSHTEFVWGLNAREVIFPKIIKLLESDLPVIQNRMNIFNLNQTIDLH